MATKKKTASKAAKEPSKAKTAKKTSTKKKATKKAATAAPKKKAAKKASTKKAEKQVAASSEIAKPLSGKAAQAKASIVTQLETRLEDTGTITFKDVSEVIPEDLHSPELIQAVLIDLKAKGVTLKDTVKDKISESDVKGDPDAVLIEDDSFGDSDFEEDEDDPTVPDKDGTAAKAKTTEKAAEKEPAKKEAKADDFGKSNDPVRIYLRKMGSVASLVVKARLSLRRKSKRKRTEWFLTFCNCRWVARRL